VGQLGGSGGDDRRGDRTATNRGSPGPPRPEHVPNVLVSPIRSDRSQLVPDPGTRGLSDHRMGISGDEEGAAGPVSDHRLRIGLRLPDVGEPFLRRSPLRLGASSTRRCPRRRSYGVSHS
jgi:hypothetical protein